MGSAHRYPNSAWRKSSHSQNNGGECLEVAEGYRSVPVRDSKVRQGPVLVHGRAAFTAFVGAVRRGEI